MTNLNYIAVKITNPDMLELTTKSGYAYKTVRINADCWSIIDTVTGEEIGEVVHNQRDGEYYLEMDGDIEVDSDVSLGQCLREGLRQYDAMR